MRDVVRDAARPERSRFRGPPWWAVAGALAALLLLVPPFTEAQLPSRPAAPTPVWTDLKIPGPSNRSEVAFAYGTPLHGSPFGLLFGGRKGGKTLADTWVFTGGAWKSVTLSVHPPPTRYGMMTWDPVDNEFVLFGGSNATAYMNDTWVYKAGRWSHLTTPVAPSPRRSGALVFDTKDGYAVLWGGHAGNFTPQSGYVMYNDTWKFLGGTWTNITRGAAPIPASEPSVAYDPNVSAVVLFGGYDQHGVGGYVALDQTWAFQGGVWKNLSLAHAPRTRDGAAIAYDPARNGVIIEGGQDENAKGYCLMNDTWLLSGKTLPTLAWTQLFPSHSPPLMDSSSAIWDGAVSQVILFGGTGSKLKVCSGVTYMKWYGTTWSFA